MTEVQLLMGHERVVMLALEGGAWNGSVWLQRKGVSRRKESVDNSSKGGQRDLGPMCKDGLASRSMHDFSKAQTACWEPY